MKYTDKLREEFISYIRALGYEIHENWIEIHLIGICAILKGNNVNLKNFTYVERRDENTYVRLSSADFDNKEITEGLFNPTIE